MTTETQRNRKRIAEAMEALAAADTNPFYALWSDDFIWRPMVGGVWSTAYQGKENVANSLFRRLRKQFDTPYTNTASNIFADGRHVVVECQGQVTLKSGKAYNNRYCFVIEMRDGRMVELREYLDSALAEAVLEPFAA